MILRSLLFFTITIVNVDTVERQKSCIFVCQPSFLRGLPSILVSCIKKILSPEWMTNGNISLARERGYSKDCGICRGLREQPLQNTNDFTKGKG